MSRVKFSVEYQFKAKPELLYNYLTQASNLQDWFADDVKVSGNKFSFTWDGAEEKAELVSKRINKAAKFQWTDREEDEYFSFDIVRDDLTNDVALIVSDFEDEDEVDDAKMMWDNSIDQLKSVIGG